MSAKSLLQGKPSKFLRYLLPQPPKPKIILEPAPALFPINTANRKKILLVDDDLFILKTLSFKLESAGYGVVTAIDGAGAIKAVREEQPNVILLDIVFPPDVAHGGGVPWDGFLLMTWLGCLKEANQVPIILMTATDLEQHKSKALAAGAKGLFQKPLDYHRVIAQIERVALHEPEALRPELKEGFDI